MILFTAAWNAPPDLVAKASDALAATARAFPALAGLAPVRTAWTGPAQVAWLGRPGLGADVAEAPTGMAIVEGIGVRRGGGAVSAEEVRGSADRRGAAGDLDGFEGQFAVLLAEPRRLSVGTDLLGLCPVYVVRQGDAWFVANRVETLARIVDDRTVDLEGASALLSVGWVVGDRTLSPSVRTVPSGQCWVWKTAAQPERRGTDAPSTLIPHRTRNVDIGRLAADLVSHCRAVADRAGGVESPLTAGLDSRLLLALLRAGGVDATYYTTGRGDSTDVRAGRELAAIAGVPHVVHLIADHDIVGGWSAIAARAVRQSDGMVNLWQVADFLGDQPNAAVSLSGVGGEIARAFYTRPQQLLPHTRDAALARFVADRAPARSGLLTPDATEAARAQVAAFADRALEWGYRPVDLGDAFYAFERVARWAGANARKVQHTPQFAPLATRVFAEAAFSLPAIRRYSEPLHWGLLRELAPELHAYPVAKGGWRSQVPYGNLVQAAVRRLQRGPSHGDDRPQLDWLEALRVDIGTQCLDRTDSPLWAVVDRTTFSRVLLDDAELGMRQGLAERLFGIVTLFEYEALRRQP